MYQITSKQKHTIIACIIALFTILVLAIAIKRAGLFMDIPTSSTLPVSSSADEQQKRITTIIAQAKRARATTEVLHSSAPDSPSIFTELQSWFVLTK